ncbi:MAG: hypothetical protein IJB79_03335 [Candidatus Gastranaerophilales bacterium]|nr:hypothetical protein [Candidatus Gastranaerophilales bacterium]
MSANSQKLQQRAALIAILNKYRNVNKIDNSELEIDIKTVCEFEDKEFVFKTLLAEIISSNGIYADICSIIAFESIDNDVFQNVAIKFLQDKKVEDNKKFIIMSLMRQKGLDFNYRDISNYVDNPEELAHSGVENFLNNALVDPEVQIDLLDFFINIPEEEKIYFLDNLKNEFSGDDLANAFSILAQLNLEGAEFEIVFETLIELNSPYSLSGLEFILNNNKLDTKTKAKLKRVIKKIKTENPKFVNGFLTKDSKVYKCFISFIDGKSNFSLVFSRKRKDETIDALFFTINITQGITSCMGFCSILEDNFATIIKRLFSDSMPVNIAPVALKGLYSHYLSKTDENNYELPYEFIVWKNMLNDVRDLNYDISEFLNSKLEVTKLTEAKVKKIINAVVMETWFYSSGENKFVDEIIEQIEKKHCLDLEKINSIVSDSIDKNFLNNKEFMAELQSKLLLQSYVSSLAKLKLTSACAYSLCFKSVYTKMLITSMIDKSIYCALNDKICELDDDNMFKKGSKTKFKKAELETLMAQIEAKWN